MPKALPHPHHPLTLQWVSRMFFGVIGVVLLLTLTMLFQIRAAQSQIEQALVRGEAALAEVDEIVQGTELLASLVQSYTTTGRTPYLDLYYEILGVWQGEIAAPVEHDRAAYWRAAVGGQRPPLDASTAPASTPRSVIDRLRALDFTPQELQAAQDVIRGTAALQVIEKIAFAATQGLYDTQTGQFVDDGQPDRDYAVELVHSPRYESLRADLVRAVGRLSADVEERTATELDTARRDLNLAVLSALLTNLLGLPLVALATVGMRRRVLVPLGRLSEATRRYAVGDYAHRTGGTHHQVAEVAALSQTLDHMAQAIADELRGRDAAQQVIAQARDQAEAAARAKSAFLANMSHEIRTPMNAIMGMTQLAMQADLPRLPQSYLRKSMDASGHLLALLNDILDYSKIEAGGLTLELGAFRVEELAGRTLGLVRQRAQDKTLELLCDFNDAALLGHRAVLRGDALRLQQVLTNLLGNAVKFTDTGEVRLELDTEPSPDGDTAALTLVMRVRDSGIGMNAEQMSQLFREFSQADASITRRFGGTGLGLAISGRLVELMGGTIKVASTPGAGSCFTVRVPLSVVETTADTVSPDGHQGLRVLVVDDRPDTRASVMALMQQLGLGSQGGLVEAASGAQAITAAQQAQADGQPFGLVLMDWVLPDMDGGRLLAALRAEQPAAKIVVMTAHGTNGLAAAAAEGGTQVLDKPVMPQDLRAMVSMHGLDSAASTSSAAGPSLQGLRVLLVEDNALNREVALGLLTHQGVDLQLAHNGLEAVERLQADGPHAFDVVLLDLQMPVLDGYDTARRIRRLPDYDRLPILAMTANAMPGEKERCLALGMQDYVPKPFVPEQLYATLARWARWSPAVPAARPAGAPVPPAAADPWPAIEMVDSARLIEHCGGNAGLARRLLRGLANDYGDGIEHWQTWLAQARWAELRREAHTLQGLAGTLAIDALRAPAQALEEAAGTEDAAAAAGHLRQVAATLARVVMALQAARKQLADTPEAAVISAPMPLSASPPTAGPQAQIDLAELSDLLADSDSRAVDWWQQHATALAAQLDPATVHALGRAIARFDFDAAWSLCQQAQELKLGPHGTDNPVAPVYQLGN